MFFTCSIYNKQQEDQAENPEGGNSLIESCVYNYDNLRFRTWSPSRLISPLTSISGQGRTEVTIAVEDNF